MPLSRAERVERRRAKLRAAGLRPVQLWVPDTSAPGFAEECRRQSLLIAASAATIEQRREAVFWARISADAWDDLY
ncbi:MAG: antitoxin MazE family protein [Acetobacteraceae bacterium]